MCQETVAVASVVVPAFNSAGSIVACVTALRNQSLAPELIEIIVVDDESQDETVGLARATGATVLTPGKVGKSGARNAGARAASGRYLLFTDADCRPEPDWVALMIQPLQQDEQIAGVKGAYRSHQTSPIARFTQLDVELRYEQMRDLETINMVDTYAAAFRRELFLALGGFDETLFEAEDADFSFRLAAAGHPLVFAPDAYVWHQHETSWRHYCQRKFLLAAGRAQVVKRYPDRLISDSRTPQTLKLQMLSAAGLVALMPAALLWPPARLLLLGAAALFMASCLPFLMHLVRQEPALLLYSLPLLFLRGLSLMAGYLYGIIWHWLPSSWQQYQPWRFP